MPRRHSDRLVFVHPSDELYGADRILLDIIDALQPDEQDRTEIWVPIDLDHAEHPLCRELERRGLTVRHLDLPILRRSYRNLTGLAALARRWISLCRALWATRPASVYCTTSAAFLAAPAARLCRVPLVVGHVQERWTGADAHVLGLLAASCGRLLAISGAVVDQLPARLQRRVALVGNSTPAPLGYHSLAGRAGPLTFVVASRWNAWKGHRTLLSAWDMAGCPGRLVVLGGKPAAGEVVDVEALVSGLVDPASVDVVGEVEDVSPYLIEADVIVVPSDDPEPFGLVAAEAFARGRPVIASGAGGLLEIVTDGRDGWLYPLRDARALAGLLRTLDRPAVALAGGNARTTYLERFTHERFASQWRIAVGIGQRAIATRAPHGDAAVPRPLRPTQV